MGGTTWLPGLEGLPLVLSFLAQTTSPKPPTANMTTVVNPRIRMSTPSWR
jgi:hypothetical protein